jgi:hypothetical protein
MLTREFIKPLPQRHAAQAIRFVAVRRAGDRP